MIEFRITQDAFDQLMAAGSVLQPIPRGPKSPFFKGDELIVKPDSHSLFNILLRSGEITVKPSATAVRRPPASSKWWCVTMTSVSVVQGNRGAASLPKKHTLAPTAPAAG